MDLRVERVVEQDPQALIAEVERRLRQAFAPEQLSLRDESQRHRAHTGHGGGLHLRLEMVSAQFRGKSLLARHRAVYAVLADLLPGPIHALALHLRAPEDSAQGT